MKKALTLLIALFVALTVAGCATGAGSAKVKCPACGYEFETPATS